MAWQFGTNFQAGKRWISAMDNTTFNKLTPQSLMKQNTEAIREMIPTMQESLGFMTPLVKSVIIEFGAMITEAFDTLNPFKDSNGFNFWEPEFDIFKLQKGPFRFGPNPITPVPIPPTPTNLISLTQRQVLDMTDTQLNQAINNDFHTYDTATQNLLTQELQRRNRVKPSVVPFKKITYISKDAAMIGFINTIYKQGNLATNVHNNIIAFGRHKSNNFFKVMTYLAAEWAKAKSLYNLTKPASAQKAIRKKHWDAITELIQQINNFMNITNFTP